MHGVPHPPCPDFSHNYALIISPFSWNRTRRTLLTRTILCALLTTACISCDSGSSSDSTNARPVARFVIEPRSPLLGETVQFDATSSVDPDGEIVEYTWFFGDGTSGSGATVNHVFDTAGSKRVTLRVTDDLEETGIEVNDVDILLTYESLGGLWEGYAEEPLFNPGHFFWVKATIDPARVLPGETVGSIEYGQGQTVGQNIVCGGDWNALDTSGDTEFLFTEIVVLGRSSCPDGKVTLRLQSPDSLLYEFEPMPSNPQLEAVGYLIRQ